MWSYQNIYERVGGDPLAQAKSCVSSPRPAISAWRSKPLRAYQNWSEALLHVNYFASFLIIASCFQWWNNHYEGSCKLLRMDLSVKLGLSISMNHDYLCKSEQLQRPSQCLFRLSFIVVALKRLGIIRWLIRQSPLFLTWLWVFSWLVYTFRPSGLSFCWECNCQNLFDCFYYPTFKL